MQRNHSLTAQSVSARSAPALARPVIEALESRQLLSAVVHHASPAVDAGISTADLKFLQQTDSTLVLEIQLGSYAAANGSNTLVTAFGSRVVTNETPVLTQLDTLASSLGITLPNTLDRADQAVASRVTRFTGIGFDPLYAQQTVKDHQSEVKAMERESAKTQIPAIQTFIDSALPVIQTDLEFAIQARDTVKPQVGAGIRFSTPRVATPTTYSKSGVVEVGTGTTTSTSTTTVNGVITVGTSTSAAGQVGASTKGLVGTSTSGLVGTGTANDGTGVQTVVA